MMILEDGSLGWYNCDGMCQPHITPPQQLIEAQLPIRALASRSSIQVTGPLSAGHGYALDSPLFKLMRTLPQPTGNPSRKFMSSGLLEDTGSGKKIRIHEHVDEEESDERSNKRPKTTHGIEASKVVVVEKVAFETMSKENIGVQSKVVSVIDEEKAESEQEQKELLEKFFFWQCMFVTIGRLSLTQAIWREMVEDVGGILEGGQGRAATRRFIFWPGPMRAIVTTEKTLKNDEKLCSDIEYAMILAKAAGSPLPLVKEEFLRDCLMKKKILPVDRYILKLPHSKMNLE